MLKYRLPFIFLVIPSFLLGQVRLGVMGGGSFSEDVIIRGSIPIEIEKSDYLSYQIELAFSVKGNKEILPHMNFDSDRTGKRVSYFEVPALLKVSLPLPDIRTYLLAGVQVGYGVEVNVEYIQSEEYFSERYTFQEARLKKIDAGITIGAGIAKPISKGRQIFVDFRYYLGLVNIDQTVEREIYNEGTYLSMGFLLPIQINPKRKKRGRQ